MLPQLNTHGSPSMIVQSTLRSQSSAPMVPSSGACARVCACVCVRAHARRKWQREWRRKWRRKCSCLHVWVCGRIKGALPTYSSAHQPTHTHRHTHDHQYQRAHARTQTHKHTNTRTPSFPRGDCAMLPIAHSTAEELAVYIWQHILTSFGPVMYVCTRI